MLFLLDYFSSYVGILSARKGCQALVEKGAEMISNELRQAASHLELLISKERDEQTVPDAFHNEIRNICVDLLETAGADGNGGCPLCCS